MMGKRRFLMLVLGGLLAVGGCASDSNEVEEKATAMNLPTEVKAGFEKEYPGAMIREVEKEEYPDGTVHYEIKFVTKEGHSRAQEFDAAGKKLGEH